jgi:hypothetical protein
MRERPLGLRLACEAAGALGDPSALPWLIDCMRDEAAGRVAAAAFSAITGIEINGELAANGSGSGPDAEPGALAHEEFLPQADAEAVLRRYRGIEAQFRRGTRYLCGREPSPSWLAQLMMRERQSTRRAVAVELLGQTGSMTLFPYEAPAFRQRELLTSYAGK